MFFSWLFFRRRRKPLIDTLPKSVSHWRDILTSSPKLMTILYKRYPHILIIVKKKKTHQELYHQFCGTCIFWSFYNSQADATLEMEFRNFRECSMKYVLKLQEVQERKKFDFVETVSIDWWITTRFIHWLSLGKRWQ